MLYLTLCILCSAALIFILKYCNRLSIPVAQAIFINYVVCTVLGAFVLPVSLASIQQALQAPWLWTAVMAGALFFATFYLISESARTAGVAITSVAQKVSLVIPVAVSLLWWNRDQGLSLLNLAGLALAVVAVGLASWQGRKPASGKQDSTGRFTRLLPVIVFLNAGIVDTLINFTNVRYLSEADQGTFTFVVFGTAAAIGLLLQVYQLLVAHKRFSWRSIPAGVVLGVPNLFSLVFLLKALSAFDNNGAFVYPILNMGVILVAAIGGLLLFQEKLRRLNLLGMGLALVALALLVVKEVK